MDKARQKHLIEVHLIAVRKTIETWNFGKVVYDDPFVAYQDGVISKRKLIEILADHLSKELE
jgi:hypothetical protein